MTVGYIKWYDEKKGYGFIETDEHGDIFFHSSNIESHGFFGLKKSDRVSFEIIDTQKGKQADKVKPV